MRVLCADKVLTITVVTDTNSLNDLTDKQAIRVAANYVEEHGLDDHWSFYELARQSYQQVEVHYVE